LFTQVVIKTDVSAHKYPDCSVTIVKLARYNGDDHFLFLILNEMWWVV